MSRNTILILQAVGVSVQTVNAGTATVLHDQLVALVIAGFAAGYQFYVHNLGNQMDPKDPKIP